MTYRAQIETLLATVAYPGDEEAAAAIGCAESTARDYRQRWQRRNGKQHENESGIMPREVVEFIFDLRNDDRLQFGEIAERVNEEHGEYYGIQVTPGQCGNVYRRHGYKKPGKSKNIDYLGTYGWEGGTLVPRYTFPFETIIGRMWDAKIAAPKFARTKETKFKTCCDFCEHLAYCLAHPEDVRRCESAWENEVLQ